MSKKFRSAHPAEDTQANTQPNDSARLHPLVGAMGVSVLATAASLLLPDEHASSAVALAFLGGTYLLCLRRDHQPQPHAYGLSLGGLMESSGLSLPRMLKESFVATGIATAIAALILPAFWFGFLAWYGPEQSFDWGRAFTWEGTSSPVLWLREMLLWHLVAVALPEEAFFRGYLQSELERRGYAGLTLFGKKYGLAIVVTSVIFALGHFATQPHPARLAVFFPSLLFGVVRTASGGIGAAMVLHAQCNLFSQWLGQGYGLY